MESIFSRGDFRFFWEDSLSNFTQIPTSWDSILNTGVGKGALSSLWINSYLNFSASFSKLGLSWDIIGLIFWILPAVLLSFFSAFLLFKYLFPNKFYYSILSGFIFLFNSYFLMILDGGQLGIALSYSLVPLTLLMFIKTIDSPSLRNSILAGLVLSLQILFDPRVVYISGISVLIYLLLNLAKLKSIKNLFSLITSLAISILLNFFWILPLVLTKNSPIPKGFDSVEGFRFFSFADFSHAFSLLHPNWPENIFGKTYFLQPEFLLLPVVAYMSLFFINSNYKTGRKVLIFAIVGLIGAFLAKGSNEPFGQINEFLFNFFPGMSMFRDPTKFYILIALSYSILISFGVWQTSEWAIGRIKFSIFNFPRPRQAKRGGQFSINSKILNSQNLFFLFTVCYLLFLIRPLFFGPNSFPNKINPIPNDYVLLKDFLNNQPNFFRTLWIPQWQRYGFFSNTHPAIGREEILKGNAKEQLKTLKESGIEQKLKDFGVKYIIVPSDSEEEIFLTDRKYDEKQYKEVVLSLQKLPWISETPGFGRIYVYEIREPKDHFWCDCDAEINYKFIRPTRYEVSVQNAKKGEILVFSESFDKNWVAESLASQGDPLRAQRFGNNLNSFILPQDGDYEFMTNYEPQKWVNIGLVISFITLVSVSSFLLFGYKGKRW